MKRRLIVLALLLVVAVGVKGVWGVYQKQVESRALRAEAEGQLLQLQAREQDLRRDIARLKDDRGIEAVLREEYQLAGEGEGVIVIVEPKEEKVEPEPTTFERFQSAFRWW